MLSNISNKKLRHEKRRERRKKSIKHVQKFAQCLPVFKIEIVFKREKKEKDICLG